MMLKGSPVMYVPDPPLCGPKTSIEPIRSKSRYDIIKRDKHNQSKKVPSPRCWS